MAAQKLLFVGLGNPGADYAETRHNVGWMALDSFAELIGLEFESESGMDAEVARKRYAGTSLIAIKPQSYMNLSGRPVAQLVVAEGLKPEALVVIHDDLDLEPGRLKLQRGRGAGGHNGVDDIIERLGSKEFARLRFGIGRRDPNRPGRDFVLEPFDATEWTEQIEPAIKRATEALKSIAKNGMTAAMNDVNRRERKLVAETEQSNSSEET